MSPGGAVSLSGQSDCEAFSRQDDWKWSPHLGELEDMLLDVEVTLNNWPLGYLKMTYNYA